jgi:cell volume regulation protein A
VSTISILAEKLKLTGPKKTTPTHSLELVSIGKADAEIIEYEVNKNDLIVNKKIVEIDFPSSVLINAIIRSDELITPKGEIVLLEGDILYILTSRSSKKKLKTLFGENNSEFEVS